MVFDLKQRIYQEDYLSVPHHSPREPVPSFNAQIYNSNFVSESKNLDDSRDMCLENAFFDLQQERNYGDNSYTSTDDVLDDDISLVNGCGDMYDIASYSGFDNSMEERRDPRDNIMMSRYEDMMAYRRWRELEDIMMTEKILRSQGSIERLREPRKQCSRLYCPSGAVLLMPNGGIHLPRQVVPTIDVKVSGGLRNTPPISFSQGQSVVDQALKRQWCSRRSSVTRTRISKKLQVLKPENVPDRSFPNHPDDEKFTALPAEVVIKVRNVHPTACLHELHVQKRKLFPKKPTFKTSRYIGTQKKGSFAVVCTFGFNGATLYTHHMEHTKSDARLNAARNMLRKLKSIKNLTILLDERTNNGAFSSFEHPRCQLLYLHDTDPTNYPKSPTFQASVCRTPRRSHGKTKFINMICHFQVGHEKLATIGAAHNKKQAIVQAARNMLKRIFPDGGKDCPEASEQPMPDNMKSPWKCHFCKIFMTGRKPFLAHLTGRSHIQRMSALELNAEEENKILQAAAEEAYKKKEDLKIQASLENSSQRLSIELERSNNREFLQQQDIIIDKNSSSQESETLNSSSSYSSEKSELETSCSHSSSGDMKVIE